LARFKREFQTVRSINVDSVIKAYQIEKYQNSLTIIMEDFGATSLNFIESINKMSISEKLRLFIQISVALESVHKQNIIHKDINPANIVWNQENDQLKIIDFGISSFLTRENPGITSPNLLEGTLSYISPEQTGRMNRAIDLRTDIYSLGVTFYELSAGQLPFSSREAIELVHCHLAKTPKAACEINPAIPKVLSDIIDKCLAKSPEDRYQSAFGITADLKRCLEQHNLNLTYDNFELGGKDDYAKFVIPQKLYGRDKEIKTLLDTFDRVSEGYSELMMVSGHSGIGKSFLINEIHKPILEKKAYFISGKFDQYMRNIPYSSVIQAFKDMVRQILAESESRIKLWKDKLLKSLGPNGQIIIDVIPEVELIIGKQRELPQLGPVESQNRFNFYFQNFVRTFAGQDHPLVIFLDDLQWVDTASLKMLELFAGDSETRYMLIIGSYRANEVDETHPLTHSLNKLIADGIELRNIRLQALDIDNVTQLVSDLVKGRDPQTQSLAELCHHKTKGNPFFLNQFLHSLYENNLLSFDATNKKWQWDIPLISELNITDNVVDLMISKIKKLPARTQEMIKLAASMGNYFNISHLSHVAEKSKSQVITELWEALAEEIIIPLDNNYKLVQAGEELDARFKFQHDRIQQAAYSLLSDMEKKQVHLKIGQLLLSYKDKENADNGLFDICNHLNYSVDLIVCEKEKQELARLNLTVAKKAKDATAYDSAIKYINAAMGLLPEDTWQSQYSFTLDLYGEGAEAAYLCGDTVQTEEWINIVLSKATSLLDKIKIYEIKILAEISQQKIVESLDTAIDILSQLGVKIPRNPSKLSILFMLIRCKSQLKKRLKGKDISDLIHLPEANDPYILATTRLLMLAVSPAYMSTPNLHPILSMKILSLSINSGHSSVSAFGYSAFGIILGMAGDPQFGYEYGLLGIKLMEKDDRQELFAKLTLLVNMFITHRIYRLK
ncbi:MAG: serine/threonine-protein kinase PknK, partial [Spirochaetota bacterium]|nr:serine/threonine-protein kinase PknK [Spirochaetota bacterium]